MIAGADKSRQQMAEELEYELVALVGTHGPLRQGQFRWNLQHRFPRASAQDVYNALMRLRKRGTLTVSARHPRRWDVA